jgi:hypothetical protein
MTNPPSTTSEWLSFFADLAEKYPIDGISTAGKQLHDSLVEFLREGALDMQADLITIIPRFHNALVQANHRGSICRRCAALHAPLRTARPEKQLMAIFGWTTMEQAMCYTEKANRKKMAKKGMEFLRKGSSAEQNVEEFVSPPQGVEKSETKTAKNISKIKCLLYRCHAPRACHFLHENLGSFPLKKRLLLMTSSPHPLRGAGRVASPASDRPRACRRHEAGRHES